MVQRRDGTSVAGQLVTTVFVSEVSDRTDGVQSAVFRAAADWLDTVADCATVCDVSARWDEQDEFELIVQVEVMPPELAADPVEGSS